MGPPAVEPVASAVLAAFRDYGWPAILAALDSLANAPGPVGRWARTFQELPIPIGGPGVPPGLEPIAGLLRPAGREHDDEFSQLSDPDERSRFTAVEIIGDAVTEDPRTVPVLLNRLEHDPAPLVRRYAARGLRPLALQPDVRLALEAAAAGDEDLEVRRAARYAISLAGRGGQPAS